MLLLVGGKKMCENDPLNKAIYKPAYRFSKAYFYLPSISVLFGGLSVLIKQNEKQYLRIF
jgi:hypothetical protein